jgi:predicted nucleic acid-binding protein
MTFLLDTNVLSEMMRRAPSPEVAAWVSRQPSESLFTASVCQAEILAGIAVLADGRRKRDLAAAAHAVFAEDFAGRVLPFDMEAAATYAEVFAGRRRAGRTVATIDLMVAAIARTQGASVVTRNLRDFDDCGVDVVNPWSG